MQESSNMQPAFKGSAPAADITVKRYLYRNRSKGVETDTVIREPDGSLRVSTSWGHFFLSPPLARWLEQDNTVLTWQRVQTKQGTALHLCLVDEAGNMLWRESSASTTVAPPPAVSYDYGGPAMGLGSRLRLQSLTSPSGSHTLLHQDDGNLVLYCNATHTPVWATDTSWLDDSWVDLTLRGDLVLRTSCGAPVWQSDTADMGVERLAVRDDGSLALLDASETAVWRIHHHAPCTAAGHTPPRGAVLRRGQTLRNQSLTSVDGGTVLYHRAGEGNGEGTRLFRADGIQLWYAPNSRAADTSLTLDNEGFLQVRADDGSVLEQLAGPGDHLIVVPGGEVRLCAFDGTVLWREGQHVIDHGDEVMTASPRTVTPAALETLLNADATPIVRTDFSDDHAWETAWRDLTMPREYWEDDVVLDAALVAIPEFEGWTGEELATLLSHTKHERLLAVDAVTLASPEHPVLVVEIDPERDQPRSFRATPHALLDVEIQLSIANMDWEDFSRSVDPDGVLRTSTAG
ncbi:DUF6924 domain-containing protein [Saccharopolyspora pogona]|uniref:DUF6924 domain-containing protein n=1 Tax=Saccharopolyspora pogona TaxID=333966 RepID=UPI0016848075|nr:Curculin domain-containing protein (mannose-binding) lectin [Saccharopolyspora pogona]